MLAVLTLGGGGAVHDPLKLGQRVVAVLEMCLRTVTCGRGGREVGELAVAGLVLSIEVV